MARDCPVPRFYCQFTAKLRGIAAAIGHEWRRLAGGLKRGERLPLTFDVQSGNALGDRVAGRYLMWIETAMSS